MEDIHGNLCQDLLDTTKEYYQVMENYLAEAHQVQLRQLGLISATEVVKRVGDLFVAEDAVTGTRRVITLTTVLPESMNRQVLKG